MPETKRCECGQRILMARNVDTGKMVPLDPSAPVYELVGTEEDGTPKAALCEMVEGVRTHMVNHFSTCPEWKRYKRERDKKLADHPAGERAV